MPSLLERIRHATDAFLGREQRFTPHEFMKLWGGTGVPHTFKPEQSLRAYGDNPYLYAATNAVCSEIANIDFHLEEKTGNEWERVEKHEALATLANPLPMKEGKSHLTKRQLFFLLGQHLLLNGEGFWLLEGRRKVNGAPTIVEPLLPGGVKLHYGQENIIEKYEYQVQGKKLEFRPEDIVHYKQMNPEDFFRGHAPTKSIRFSIDTHLEADILNLARLQNGAVPVGVLKSDKKIHDDERKKYLQAFKQMFSGTKNAGKVAFLPENISYDRIQESNQEMQYAESKERNRDEILANFRIGLEMLGRTEAQTRANADAAIYVFSRFVVLPMLHMITDTLNNDYLSQFPGSEGMRFNFVDPVPENTEEKRLNITTLADFAALTPDEARTMLGLQPLEIEGVTDVPYVVFNRVPASFSEEEEEPPERNLAAA